jgi:hypothetical protein
MRMISGRLLISVAALALGLLRPTVAGALGELQSVQSLLDACKSSTASVQYAACVGYIAGVGDMMQMLGVDKEQHTLFAICAKPSYGAMVQAYINWAEANPKEWGENRLFGVMLALGENWACASK